jgi:hypothetical protein
MDEDTQELVVRLLTRAGMMMEDASAQAILAVGRASDLSNLVADLTAASDGVAGLLAGAMALLKAPAIHD